VRAATRSAAHVSLLSVLLCSLAGVCNAQPSLLQNGDFEAGDGARPEGWSRSLYPGEQDAGQCVSRSREQARSGDWALRIDTGPVVGQELTIVFNGSMPGDPVALRGKTVALTGWVYVEPGTAVRPIQMRLRAFGPDDTGAVAFIGDALSVQVLGQPGAWSEFSASGTVPAGSVTSLDLHCGIRPDTVPTVQFLDDIRIEQPSPGPLTLRLPRARLWSDEETLAVEARVDGEATRAGVLLFSLLGPDDRELSRWEREVNGSVYGLALPRTALPEGTYRLLAELQDDAHETVAKAEAALEVAESPWERAPRALTGTEALADTVEGFDAMGTAAPVQLVDALPSEAEQVSADLPVAEWEGRGYALFSRASLDPPSRLGRPLPGETGPVRLFACPGEYEPATVSVWALKPLSQVAVTVSDLRGERAAIGAGSVDLRLVRSAAGLPRFLERARPVGVPAGQTQTYWLTVHIPADAPPGFYRGEVHVRSPGVPDGAAELLVRVLPLSLPATGKGYGFWWKMDGRWDGHYSQEREAALEQIRKQFVLLREHGCNLVSCYGMPRTTRSPDGTLSLDFDQDHWGHDRFSFADFLRLGKETGFLDPNQPIQYPGAESLHSEWIARELELDADPKALDDFYRDVCKRVDEWAKAQGFRLAFACIDEIGNSEERRRDADRFYRIAHEAGVLTSVTDNSMHGGVHLMAQPRFDDSIDMRLYNFIMPEMIENTRQSGDRLWLYNLGSTGRSAPLDRLVFGLFTDRCGAEGYVQWAFQWPSGNTDPYDAAAAGTGTGYHYALPAPDGPLPTVALEGVREGIDDARYLAALRARSPQAAEEIIADIPMTSTEIGSFLEQRDASWFGVRRWRVARAAMGG